MIKICPVCNKEFEKKRIYSNKPNLYCSKSCSKKGAANPSWKGDGVGYKSLHEWVANHKHKPTLCEKCGEDKKLDLSSKGHTYTRNIDDWEWLCRKCHYEMDKRHITFLAYTRSRRLQNINCLQCGVEFHPSNSKILYCSKSCSCTHINIHKRDYSKRKIKNN